MAAAPARRIEYSPDGVYSNLADYEVRSLGPHLSDHLGRSTVTGRTRPYEWHTTG
jgi:hypothetical protein